MNEPSDEDNAADLNMSTYLAMARVNGDVVGHLVKLLRSNIEIDPTLRSAIADAFEKKNVRNMVTFEVENKVLPGRQLGDSFRKFQRDMAIARFLETVRRGPPRTSKAVALKEAEAKFGMSEDTCKKAPAKRDKMLEWLAGAYPTRPHHLRSVSDDQYMHIMEVEYFLLMQERKLGGA